MSEENYEEKRKRMINEFWVKEAKKEEGGENYYGN